MTKHAPGLRPDPEGQEPAAVRAQELTAAVRDDPAERLRLATGFYDQRIGGRSIRAYRRAEVAFMKWQIRCGVLAAQDGSPASPSCAATTTRSTPGPTSTTTYGGPPAPR